MSVQLTYSMGRTDGLWVCYACRWQSIADERSDPAVVQALHDQERQACGNARQEES